MGSYDCKPLTLSSHKVHFYSCNLFSNIYKTDIPWDPTIPLHINIIKLSSNPGISAPRGSRDILSEFMPFRKQSRSQHDSWSKLTKKKKKAEMESNMTLKVLKLRK